MAIDLVARIESFVEDEMSHAHMPGLALAVLREGEHLLERGFGYADLERRESMTERTQIIIGSTTKAMTAAAALQLQEAGYLRLDDPVRRHVPSFHLADDAAADSMTLRQVLTHTAGLPPTPIDAPSFLPWDGPAPTAAEYVDELITVYPLWPPGNGWLYANDGFTLAGLAIESASGSTYPDYMHQRVFAPLGMSDTYVAASDPESRHAVPYDYGPDGMPYPSFVPRGGATDAAGMVFSTAHDAAVWLGALLDGIDGRDGAVLSGDSVREMVRPQAREAPDRDYALGWTIRTVHGVRVADHGGSVITMGSHFILEPEHRIGIAVLANSSTSATEVVAEGVLALLSGREPRRSFPGRGRQTPLDAMIGRRLAGLYVAESPSNGFSSPLSIEYTGESLRALTYPGGPHHPPGDIHFTPAPGGDLNFMLFGRGKTGTAAHFDLHRDTVKLMVGNVALRQVTAQCHRGTVVRWSGGGKDAQ